MGRRRKLGTGPRGGRFPDFRRRWDPFFGFCMIFYILKIKMLCPVRGKGRFHSIPGSFNFHQNLIFSLYERY